MKIIIAALSCVLGLSTAAFAGTAGVAQVKSQCHVFAPKDQQECYSLIKTSDFNDEAVRVCSDAFVTISDLWQCYRTIAGLKYTAGDPQACRQRAVVHSDLYACPAGTGR